VFTIKSDDGQQSYRRGFLYVANGGETTLPVSGLSGPPSIIWKNDIPLESITDYTIENNIISFTSALGAGDYILVYSSSLLPTILSGVSIGSSDMSSTVLTRRFILLSDVPAIDVSISATSIVPDSSHVSAFTFAPDNNDSPVMSQASSTFSLSNIKANTPHYFWLIVTIPPNQPTESWNDVALIVTGSPFAT